MAQTDELVATRVFCEVLRCERGDETRIYNLRSGSGGAELWRVTEISGQAASAVKECGFKTPEEAAEFLDEVRRTLRVAGWKEM